MTRAEIAFSALDKNKKGYITAKELMKLTKKLSKEELMNLMTKVALRKHYTTKHTNQRYFQLDTDGDGQLTIDEFKVLFSNADKRKKEPKKKPSAEGHQPAKVVIAALHKIQLLFYFLSFQALRGSQPEQKGQMSKRKESKDRGISGSFASLSLRSLAPSQLGVAGEGKDEGIKS